MSPSPTAERYLSSAYARVRGASSKLSAVIATRLLAIQSARGLSGHVAEIGVFEGRFFIALALCAQSGEKAIATDVFTWPDEGVADRFLANCREAEVAMDAIVLQKTSSRRLTPAAYAEVAEGPVRFLHIDGAHTYDGVRHDLSLAEAALHAEGVVCLDDVLHARYPALTMAVGDWLRERPDFTLLAVIDRESFASACKYLVCRRACAAAYRDGLAEAAPEHLMKFRAAYFGDEALIFAPTP